MKNSTNLGESTERNTALVATDSFALRWPLSFVAEWQDRGPQIIPGFAPKKLSLRFASRTLTTPMEVP